MTETFIDTIEIDGEEQSVLIEASYFKAYKGARDGKYGPPLEPDEPEHWEIEAIYFPNGKNVPDAVYSTDQAEEAVNKQWSDRIDSRWAERDEYLDSRYED